MMKIELNVDADSDKFEKYFFATTRACNNTKM